MKLYHETALRKQADGPTLTMLDLWRSLSKQETGVVIEVMIGDRKEHTQLRSYPGELYTAYPHVIGGKVVLELWMDSLRSVKSILVTHELGHWILKLQGFSGVIYTRQKHNNTEILLNSMAHHPPLYNLQRSVGHEPQNEIDSRCENDIRIFSRDKESKRREIWVSNAFLLFDDVLNCSKQNRVAIENVVSRRYPKTWNLVKEILELAQSYDLLDANENATFCQKVIEELELGKEWKKPDEVEALRRLVEKAGSVEEAN